MASSHGSLARRILLSLLVLLLCASAVFLIVLLFGRVKGEEFAPTHFQSRSFQYYEIPLVHIQVTPIERKSTTDLVSQHVRSRQYVTVAQGPPEQWDIVELNGRPGDAELLTSVLELRQDGKLYWEEWSEDNPQAAQVLWPIVQKLATRQLYVLLPDVFEIARLDPDPQSLKQRIDSFLAPAYADLTEDLAAAGKLEHARTVLDEALAEYPQQSRLREMKARLSP